MDREEFQEIFKEVLNESLEKHLGTVHEEISDLRGEVDGLRKEMLDGFAGLKSDTGGLHNRIDNETFARKNLEQRIRKVLPKMPEVSSAQ